MDPVQYASAQSSDHQPLELVHVLAEEFGGLRVERIVRIGFVEQVNESVNDAVNVQNGFPIFAKNVETNLALQINVGVVYFGFANALGRFVRIVLRNGEGKVVRGALPVSRIGRNRNIERR